MYRKLFIIMLISIVITSCTQVTNDGGSTNYPSDGDYFIPYEGTETMEILTQYDEYYFAGNESRPIYVYGKTTKDKLISEISVYTYGSEFLGKTTVAPLDNADHFYTGSHEYTLPVIVNGSTLVNSQTLTIWAGTGNDKYNNVTTIGVKIPDRVIDITHYFYTSTSDILEVAHGINPKLYINNVFQNDANISVTFPTSTTNYDFSYTKPVLSNQDMADELLDWFETTTNTGTAYYADKDIVLLGVPDYERVNSNDIPMTGAHVISWWGDTMGTSYIFIFRNKQNTAQTEAKRKKYELLSTMHELGHARGRYLSPTEQEFSNPFDYMKELTNQLPYKNPGDPDYVGYHEFGHYGNHHQHCIMHGQFAEDGDGDCEQRDNPHFCDGHKQMLLNTNWN